MGLLDGFNFLQGSFLDPRSWDEKQKVDLSTQAQMPPMMNMFQDPLANSKPLTPHNLVNMPTDEYTFQPQNVEMSKVGSVAAGQVNPVQQPSFMDKVGDTASSIGKGISDFTNDRERMLRLAQGFNSMRLEPDQGLATAIQGELKDLRAHKGANKTADALRKMGRPDLANAVEQGMDATAAWKEAVSGGDTKTIQNLKWRAKEAGLEEGTPAYKNFILNAGADKGLSLTVSKDGTISFSQGGKGGSDKALTEGQSNATMFYGRMRNSLSILDETEKQGTQMGNALLNKVPLLGNYLISDEGQRYEQAKTNFLTALLRKESGAKIGEDEVALGDSQYFPQPGDSPAVIAQKNANRKSVTAMMRIVAATGADKLDATTPQSTPQQSTQDTSNIPTATTIQQLDALNKGDKYVDAMGKVRTKNW